MKSVSEKLLITSEDKMVNTSTYSFENGLTWIIEQNGLFASQYIISSCC